MKARIAENVYAAAFRGLAVVLSVCSFVPANFPGAGNRGERKANILTCMDVRDHLPPKQVLDLLASRVRKRIRVLEEIRLSEYGIAVHELRVMLDLLQRAAAYVERSEGKNPRSGLSSTR